ncbi:MAG: hypothetical protein ABI600_16390 [Luteolibacter sp.]
MFQNERLRVFGDAFQQLDVSLFPRRGRGCGVSPQSVQGASRSESMRTSFRQSFFSFMVSSFTRSLAFWPKEFVEMRDPTPFTTPFIAAERRTAAEDAA